MSLIWAHVAESEAPSGSPPVISDSGAVGLLAGHLDGHHSFTGPHPASELADVGQVAFRDQLLASAGAPIANAAGVPIAPIVPPEWLTPSIVAMLLELAERQLEAMAAETQQNPTGDPAVEAHTGRTEALGAPISDIDVKAGLVAGMRCSDMPIQRKRSKVGIASYSR